MMQHYLQNVYVSINPNIALSIYTAATVIRSFPCPRHYGDAKITTNSEQNG